ncbi:MAG: dolichyl-phosphate-mannose--protein mannosyltransferase [Mycobacterium leprae]
MVATSAARAPRTPAATRRAPLLPPLPGDRAWGWLGPGLVTLLAAYLRFDRLALPRAVIFDETYYAKDALALLRFGHERATVDVARANAALLAGRDDIWASGPAFVVHPPVGKWMIAVGEQLFGVGSFGWRFSAALVGSLSVLVLARTARRMTRSTLLGSAAGLLLALDGLHFVHSRIAMLDIFVMFWIVAAFGCLVVDRDTGRARLAAALEGQAAGFDRGGPRLGVRWWRVGAGACLGLALGTKWSAAFYVVAFAALAFAWDVGARRAAGSRAPLRAALRRDALPVVLALGLLPATVYVASWGGWFATGGGWDRQWADGRTTSWPFVPAALRSWWHYHAEIYHFHITLEAKHPYESSPFGWLALVRPVSYFYTSPRLGHLGCTADTCAREVLAIGTPAIWWAAIPALVAMAWLWVSRRDWRAAAVLVGVGAGWLPWFATPGRTMFLFYALPMLPFLVLAVTLGIGMLLGSPGTRRRRWAAAATGAYLVVVVLNFFYLYPVLAARVLPYAQWRARMWLSSWI